jgi:CheY-like chemotaxis protein
MLYSNILLIDDDEDDQEIFVTALKELGSAVVCQAEHSAREALRKLENSQVAADVIFLDLNMPIMNGIQFLKEVKKKESLKDIPVIILTTSSNSETIKETKALGAADFITKPNNFSELKKILQSIIV